MTRATLALGASAHRALLFCPGTERHKIEKAAGLEVDAVILDLEDAAALSMKAEARATTVAALGEVDFGESAVWVRINPIGSGFQTGDLAALGAGARLPVGVVLPKVSAAGQIVEVSESLGRIEQHRGVPEGTIGILGIIETALGVVRLGEIAAADQRLCGLIFGAEDLAGDLGARRSPEGWEVFYARSAVVMHARALGLAAIDTPFVDLHDEEGLRREAQSALHFGFTGKLAIHPKQLTPIRQVFTPTPEEVAAARRLIGEHQRHQSQGRGVFELDGRMVDMPMVRAAERVLRRAGQTTEPG